ncbi:hypothetical protein Hdeb2414_s0018g00537101 [Helianthus debilis subsp. tardiflorus]
MTSVTSSAFLLPSVSPNKCWSSALRRNPKKLLVRAARIESKGVSLGSRTPHFEDGPVFMAEDARTFNYPFLYLYDPV